MQRTWMAITNFDLLTLSVSGEVNIDLRPVPERLLVHLDACQFCSRGVNILDENRANEDEYQHKSFSLPVKSASRLILLNSHRLYCTEPSKGIINDIFRRGKRQSPNIQSGVRQPSS